MKQETTAATVPTDRLESAFRTLANETRVRILFELYDSPDRAVSFSDLNDRVGLGDSGRFNYHLKQLTGRFIYRTDEGYSLLFSGLAVCRSMLASFADEHSVEPFALDSECYDCGATLVARYDHEYVVIGCPDCGIEFHDFPFPPGTLAGRDTDDLLWVYDGWMRAQTALAVDGLCTWCFGRRTSELVAGEDPDDPPTVVHTCQRCGADMHTAVGETFQSSPAVIAFLYDHGIDVRRTPSWEIEYLWDDEYVVVESTDPWRVRFTIPADGETFSLTIDGDVRVLDVTRE
ncbi:ArsR/SmtB family transcription factor [Halococcus salsus]|uniref:ArsR/SmtB family transcription factor n=1 Tax=Halococcus salsus TaxID=2162894 RepID=UPI00135C4D00|nr:winged helix-turn-helix domain-containing protein [Halococcus salsus]